MMVFVHFALIKLEKIFLSLDARGNHLVTRYIRGFGSFLQSLSMAPLTTLFQSEGIAASGARRAKLARLMESGQVSQLVALSREVCKRHRSDLLVCITRTLCPSSSKKTKVIDALLTEKLLETSCLIDNFGWTLLHRAVYDNNVQLVEVLLKHGASVADRDTNGNTALHVAIQACQVIEKSALCGRLSAQMNDADGHYDIETEGSCKKHYASIAGVARRLIEAAKAQQCCLIRKANYFGKTPLHYAVLLKPTPLASELIKLLIDEGADVDSADERGRTPLYHLLTNYKHSNSNLHRYKSMGLIMSLVKERCDQLNLKEILGEIPDLKCLARVDIQRRVEEPDSLRGVLPNELIIFLKRRIP